MMLVSGFFFFMNKKFKIINVRDKTMNFFKKINKLNAMKDYADLMLCIFQAG